MEVREWNLDDPVTVARLGVLARCSAILADYESVRLRPRPDLEAPGEVVGGQDRGSWYYTWLANHIQNWAQGAFEAFEGEEDVSVDAVDLTTVHQAKGLEWPVVFVPCVSARRFPSKNTGSRRPWHVPREAFSPARYEGSVDDERRLFYVAITRARDWLSVSTHDRVTTPKAKPSPFLLELAGGAPPSRAELALPPAPPPGAEDEEPLLTITFSDLARYQVCGLAYRLRALIGFQPPLAPELGYGKAVHHLLREVADQTRRCGRPPTPAQVERLFDDHFALPAASKPAPRQLKAAARNLVDRYVSEWSEDLERVWEVERPFQLHLPGAVVSGRADGILDKEDGHVGSLAIVDYKTAVDAEDDRAHDLQLQVYTDAGRREGLEVRAAYVHDLTAGDRDPVDVSGPAIGLAETTVVSLVDRLRARDFRALPGARKCSRCDVRALCRWAV
ncbi:MAG: PD-(D/E)XK nuclease family protein [Acidimicrobiales bacterium]